MGSDVVSCVETGTIPFPGRIEPCKKQGLNPTLCGDTERLERREEGEGRKTRNAEKAKDVETQRHGTVGILILPHL